MVEFIVTFPPGHGYSMVPPERPPVAIVVEGNVVVGVVAAAMRLAFVNSPWHLA